MVTPDSADAAAARATDRPAKLARIRELLDAHGARELALTAPENLAWFFDGARVQVPYAGAPVARAVVDREGGVRVHALANEVDRLTAEELGGVEMHPVPWPDSLPDPAPDVLVDTAVAAELRAARAVLLPVERARYAALGAEVAHATGEVLRRARPEHSEQALAGELARTVVARGAAPVVGVVARGSRVAWRHPLPTAAPLGRRAMAVVGARRHGLVVNLTRWVRFGAADAAEAAADAALREVEAAAFAATRPGRTLAEALADIRDAYPAHGFDAEEWTRHHQGGPTGYLGRDPKATFATHDVIRAGQAFAWNPSAPGAKVEDTVVVDADGIRVLTSDPDWPSTQVHGLDRPLELEL
jgi:Xaa-Pro aminopeptidase